MQSASHEHMVTRHRRDRRASLFGDIGRRRARSNARNLRSFRLNGADYPIVTPEMGIIPRHRVVHARVYLWRQPKPFFFFLLFAFFVCVRAVCFLLVVRRHGDARTAIIFTGVKMRERERRSMSTQCNRQTTPWRPFPLLSLNPRRTCAVLDSNRRHGNSGGASFPHPQLLGPFSCFYFHRFGITCFHLL